MSSSLHNSIRSGTACRGLPRFRLYTLRLAKMSLIWTRPAEILGMPAQKNCSECFQNVFRLFFVEAYFLRPLQHFLHIISFGRICTSENILKNIFWQAMGRFWASLAIFGQPVGRFGRLWAGLAIFGQPVAGFAGFGQVESRIHTLSRVFGAGSRIKMLCSRTHGHMSKNDGPPRLTPPTSLWAWCRRRGGTAALSPASCSRTHGTSPLLSGFGST